MTKGIRFVSESPETAFAPVWDYSIAIKSTNINTEDLAKIILEKEKEIIENYSGELDVILGNLFLLKGKVFDLQGDRRNAIEYYKKCIGLNNLSSAIKDSKQYLKKPYTDYGS